MSRILSHRGQLECRLIYRYAFLLFLLCQLNFITVIIFLNYLDYWRVLVNAALNLQVPKAMGLVG